MENFSFATIVTNLVNRLKLQTLWQAPLFHSVYQILLETLAFGISKLSFLAYALYREASWWSATQISSLTPRTRILSYIPKRNQCPFGSIYISPDPNLSSTYQYRGASISIPKWTTLTDNNGDNTCFVVEDYVYYKDFTGNLEINVKVGVPKTYKYISKGIPNEIFYIYSELIDNDEMEIYIIDENNNILSEITIVDRDHLYFIYDLENYYCEVGTLDDFQGVYFKFGDNVNTNNVSVGTNILIKYAETNGANDNITNADVITKFSSTLYNTLGVLSPMYILQSEALSDGSYSETVEEIKYNAPINFDTAYNLNRLDNYSTFLPANVSYILKFIAWTNETLGDSMDGTDGQMIYGCAVSNDGSDLTAVQKEETLLDWIKPYKAPTEVFQWENLQKIYIRIKSKIYIPISAQASTVIQSINTAFYDAYSILNVEFKQNIYNSEIYSLVQTVPNVVRHNTELWYLEIGANHLEVNYPILTLVPASEQALLIKQILLKQSAIEIMLKRKINGVWQEAIVVGYAFNSEFIGANGFTIVDSFIDYINGWLTYTIEEIENDVTHTIYGVKITQDSDLILLGYQIGISYQTTDGYQEQNNDFRLNNFYFIGDVDTLYNEIDTEFES